MSKQTTVGISYGQLEWFKSLGPMDNTREIQALSTFFTIAAGIILVGMVAVLPNLRYRVLLPFQGEKSGFNISRSPIQLIMEYPGIFAKI